jgi:radical SAM superfamily enzyme YgiQ (UPF0313 family)
MLDEIEILVKEYGVRGINIQDDLFTITPQRVIEFCDQLMSRKLKISWLCLARVDCITPEMLKIMKKAGCWQIQYGIESGNQKILNTINKNITLEAVERAVKWTKEANIRTLGFFMLGLPGDDDKSMRETLIFAKRLDLDRVYFCITQPFPGSELYEIALATESIRKDIEYRYYNNTNFHRNTSYVTNGLTPEFLKKFRHRSYREFYLRPAYLLKQLLSYREFERFPERIVTFLKAII